MDNKMGIFVTNIQLESLKQMNDGMISLKDVVKESHTMNGEYMYIDLESLHNLQQYAEEYCELVGPYRLHLPLKEIKNLYHFLKYDGGGSGIVFNFDMDFELVDNSLITKIKYEMDRGEIEVCQTKFYGSNGYIDVIYKENNRNINSGYTYATDLMNTLEKMIY